MKSRVVVKCLSLVLVCIQSSETVGALKNVCYLMLSAHVCLIPPAPSHFDIFSSPGQLPVSIFYPLNSYYTRVTCSSTSVTPNFYISPCVFSHPPTTCHDSSGAVRQWKRQIKSLVMHDIVFSTAVICQLLPVVKQP